LKYDSTYPEPNQFVTTSDIPAINFNTSDDDMSSIISDKHVEEVKAIGMIKNISFGIMQLTSGNLDK
jgi:hypothetical protein